MSADFGNCIFAILLVDIGLCRIAYPEYLFFGIKLLPWQIQVAKNFGKLARIWDCLTGVLLILIAIKLVFFTA